jgi:translation initiation factor 2 alpha subunit (eIF-2alpha)
LEVEKMISLKEIKCKIIKWVRWILKRYNKEIVEVADLYIGKALQKVDSDLLNKMTPKIKKSVRRFIIEQIDAQGLDPRTDDFADTIAMMVMKKFDEEMRGV